MTDQQPDLPTAGRKPPHAFLPSEPLALPAGPSAGPSTDEEPTVVQPPPPGAVSDGTAGGGPDEPTRPLARPALPAATDEEATQRLGSLDPVSDGPGAPEEVAPGVPVEVAPDVPEEAASGVPEEVAPDAPEEGAPDGPPEKPAPWRRLSSAGALIWVLLALFGFTLVVQLRSNDGDQGLATMRQEDLVRILSDLESQDSRLQSQITALENSQRQLTSNVTGRQAALAEAQKRSEELGLLAGTLPGRGPGLKITVDKVKASAILNAVQELRGAGGEVMQVTGVGGSAVRVVASSYFVDAEGGGIIVDGARLTGPYTLLVIGSPQTMQTALQIPGGVVASVNSGGGSVTMEQMATVEVTAVRKATSLQYAKPVS